MRVTAEESLLFACTRQRFEEDSLDAVRRAAAGAIDWDEIFQLSQDQGVAPLVWRNLQVCAAAVPERVACAFAAEEAVIRRLKRECAEGMSRILAFCRQRSIDVMLLPGLVLDLWVYDDRALTFGRDADLLFRAAKTLSDAELHELRVFMSELSAEFRWFTDRYTRYEYFEYDFDEHHDATMNDMLPVDFARIWARAERRSVFADGESAFVPDAVSALIMLCVWSARKRFFRLKNLCDITEFVDKSRNGLDFAALVAQCREYRCDDIVLAALSAARSCLGAALPDAVLDELANGRPRAALVRWLVQRRSFAPLRLFSFTYGQNQQWRRRVDQSLLLPYATYRPAQVAKKLVWVLRVKNPLQPAG